MALGVVLELVKVLRYVETISTRAMHKNKFMETKYRPSVHGRFSGECMRVLSPQNKMFTRVIRGILNRVRYRFTSKL